MGSRSGCKWVMVALLLCLTIRAAHPKKKQKVEIITEVYIFITPPHTIIEHTHTPSSQTKPEDCIQGAEIGDKLTVHYTVNKVMCPSFCTKHMPYSRVHSPAEKFLTALVREILSPLNSELNKSFQVAPHCFPSGE